MTPNAKAMEAAALVALARANIPVDVQDLLIQGNPMRDVAPGALFAAITNVLRASLPALLAETRKKALEEARHATRNAVLNMRPQDRMNGDLVDDALFRAILALQESKHEPC